MNRRDAIKSVGLAAGAAAVAVSVDRVLAEPELSDEELALLTMASRDFTADDMHEFPSFDRDGAVVAMSRSMVERGLVELAPCHVVMPDGDVVSETFLGTPYGKAVLERERRRRGRPS